MRISAPALNNAADRHADPERRPSTASRRGARELAHALELELEGEVRFDNGSRALYATDASNFRQVPIGVVIPRTLEDVVATHRVCAGFNAPIVNRGGGTSLSGETVNFAVVIDHSKYLTRIYPTDVAQRRVTCETGAINEQVNRQTGQDNLVFAPDPSTHSRCTIGGNVGNNSCGIHSVQAQFYGPGPRTSDNTHALDVVTYGGDRFSVGINEEARLEEIIRAGGRKGTIYGQLRGLRDRYADLIRAKYPSIEHLPRRVSGYNLDELLPERGFNVARALVGTESTCATALTATVLLTPALLHRSTVVVAYEDIAHAGQHVPDILTWRPIGLEAMDRLLWEDQQQLRMHPHELQELPRPGHAAWLLVQFGADSVRESHQRAEEFAKWLKSDRGYADDQVAVFESPEQTRALWEIREAGLGATAFPPDGRDHWPGWEDSAVPPERVGNYVQDLKRLYDKHGYRGAIYGHFGQGCIHSRISFDLRTATGIDNYRSFLEEAADLVVSYGGSLSGEHGDGQQRAELLVKQYGPELMQAMREFKAIWDPQGRMNPGKVMDPYPFDAYLKLGTTYNPPRPETKFTYLEDGGDFAHAALRCVGVGKCRVPETEAVMCPSYMATREEKHSTRGRARLLFEMLQGEVVTRGWRSPEVKDALDLCLACKGCTNDCPVHVDMPRYKAEFLYHHYARRLRPRYAYAFGFIDQAARVAAIAPEIVNFLTHAPLLAPLAKWMVGMSGEREIPAFAPLTLQAWFQARGGTRNPDGPRVVLWPDTFNNYFHTDVGVACVEALEAAGWQVIVPSGHVCCGRPLYDYGFLDMAERYLNGVLDTLREYVRADVPIVGMEPSCVAVFKDELPKMLPHDDDARRLVNNVYHWPEFFERFDVAVPTLQRKALVWGHCHHKATGGMEPERRLLERMGLDVKEARGGCCGLAGAWGFEAGHHDVSSQCGDAGFFPAVRGAADDTLVIADGFSCKTQLQQSGSPRRALHVAQVMQMARLYGRAGYRGGRPETSEYMRQKPSPPASRRMLRVAAPIGLLAVAVSALAAGVMVRSRSNCT